jgi:hypothetical protein
MNLRGSSSITCLLSKAHTLFLIGEICKGVVFNEAEPMYLEAAI